MAHQSSEGISSYFFKVHTKCDKIATVVRLTKLTISAMTEDCGQFITPSAHLCVQHDMYEEVHRAGPSATADTWSNITDKCSTI